MQDEEILNTDEIIEDTNTIDVDDVSFEAEDGEGNTMNASQKLKMLRDKLKISERERMDNLTGWQRAKADYVNLQKEEEQKRKDMRTYVTTDIIEQLLPVLDSFDMAFANKEAWEKVDANWRSGIEYIHAQFLRVLADNNVTSINQTNVPFDHNIHEAIENIETDEQSKDHTVATIIQSGYKIGDRIIRPARVKVFEFKK
ncbi:MAG: nucleotide exchange factor GrpE [bacterium]